MIPVMRVRGPRRVSGGWLATFTVIDEHGDPGWGRCLNDDLKFLVDWLEEAIGMSRMAYPDLVVEVVEDQRTTSPSATNAP